MSYNNESSWSVIDSYFKNSHLHQLVKHQLDSYHLIMKNKAETLTSGSSQPEVFNVLGQLQTIERVKKERGQLEHTKREALTQESELGAKPE